MVALVIRASLPAGFWSGSYLTVLESHDSQVYAARNPNREDLMKCNSVTMAFMAIAMSLLASAGRADYVGTAVLYQADGQYSGGYGGEFNTTLTYSGTSSLKAAAQYSPVQLDSAVGGVGTGSSTVAVFQTLCIQEGSNDVTFSPGTYYAATIETTAYNSNSPPPPNDTQTVSPITAALFSRFSSRGNETFANKILSAMRFEFGGHHEKPAEK